MIKPIVKKKKIQILLALSCNQLNKNYLMFTFILFKNLIHFKALCCFYLRWPGFINVHFCFIECLASHVCYRRLKTYKAVLTL